MRRMVSMILLFSMALFFQSGCGGLGMKINPHVADASEAFRSNAWSNSWAHMEEPSVDFTPFIIGAVVLVTAALTYAHYSAKHDKVRFALIPGGERVKLIMHAEAPADAVFLGDLHTVLHRHLTYLKNDLRNQTARLGGDLVVLDDIQQEIFQSQTWGYIGIGRAYKTKDGSQ